MGWDELCGVLEKPEALSVLQDLRVDVNYLGTMMEMLYEEQEQLPIHDIMDVLLCSRGDRDTKLQDLVSMLQLAQWNFFSALSDRERDLKVWLQEFVKAIGK